MINFNSFIAYYDYNLGVQITEVTAVTQTLKESFVRFNMRRTSRDFVARLDASRPKKLALLTKKLVRSTCSKSSSHVVLSTKKTFNMKASFQHVQRYLFKRGCELFLFSIYQISEQQFSRVLIGSRNSEYPWLFTVLRPKPRWRLVSRRSRKTKFER